MDTPKIDYNRIDPWKIDKLPFIKRIERRIEPIKKIQTISQPINRINLWGID